MEVPASDASSGVAAQLRDELARREEKAKGNAEDLRAESAVELTQAIAELKQEHTAAVDALEAERKAVITTLGQEQAAAVESLERELALQLQSAKAEHASEITAMELEHLAEAQRSEEMLARVEAALVELQSEHAKTQQESQVQDSPLP